MPLVVTFVLAGKVERASVFESKAKSDKKECDQNRFYKILKNKNRKKNNKNINKLVLSGKMNVPFL